MERLKLQRKENPDHEQQNTFHSSQIEQNTFAQDQTPQMPIPEFAHNFANISVFAPEHTVQRKATQRNTSDSAAPNLNRRIQAAAGSGSALEQNVQTQLETGIGADLSGVRVHNDSEADQLSHELHANAFTTGNDIFFRQGLYNPNSSDGMRLLAHEATHTVQQANGSVDGISWGGGVKVSDPNDRFEQAAEATANNFMNSSPVGVAPTGGSSGDGVVQREAALEEEDKLEKPKPEEEKELQLQRDSSNTLMVQRDTPKDGSMILPAENIKGRDPNVVRLPEDKIKAKDPDEETRKVMQNIAAARTRAIAYLEGSKTEVMMAVNTFKGHANSEIEALDLDPSAAWDLVPILLGAVGGVVAGAFPPAAAVVITANLVVGAGKNVSVTGKKEETVVLKQGLKKSVLELGEKIISAQSAGIIKVNEQLPTQLNEMAATDRGVWDLLKVGNDRQLDDVLARLFIRDPHQNSPFGNVLKAMMAAFGKWMGKAKFQHGMTGSDKLISELIPGTELNQGLRSAERTGERGGLDHAREMIEQHEKGPTP